MRKTFKLYVLILCLFLCGCGSDENRDPAQITIRPEETVTPQIEYLIPMVTPSMVQTPPPLLTPTVAPTPQIDPNEAFLSLDEDIFRYYVAKDKYTLNSYLKHAESCGIDAAIIETGWGSYSVEGFSRDLGKETEFYDSLHAIDRQGLSPENCRVYDTLLLYFEQDMELLNYVMYKEPLSAVSGIHTTLPVKLALMDIASATDAELYISLVLDLPRYFNEILLFETQKAQYGSFMTADSYALVTEQINSIISEGAAGYLFPLFESKVNSVSDISSAEREELINRCREAIETSFNPAYQILYEGLQELSYACRYDEGLSSLGKDGKNYYIGLINALSCTDSSVDNILALLEDEAYAIILTASEIRTKDPESDYLKNEISIPSLGSMEEDIKYLRTLSENRLGKLSDHELCILEADESIASLLSPAIYFRPKLDDMAKQTVLLNRSVENPDGILILAHETYPGHLYQYMSQQEADNDIRSLNVLPFTGYEEGWALCSEKTFILLQGQFSENALLLYHFDNAVLYSIMPAIVSIRVNAYGDSLDDIRGYLSDYGLEENAEAYYRYAIVSPDYYIPYAVGYAYLSQMIRRAEQDLESRFDLTEYLTEFLALGPGYFPVLEEQMDLWVDERFAG